MPNLAKSTGHIFTDAPTDRKNKQKNSEMFSNHESSAWHTNSISYAQKLESGEISDAYDAVTGNLGSQCHWLEPTANTFYSIFAATHMNLPLFQYPYLMSLQKQTGGNIGKHHLNQPQGTLILNFIGDNIHKNIVNYILTTDYPLSIIVDGATDPRQRHYMTIHLQTLEKGRPMIYFFKMVTVGVKEDNKSLFEIIKNTFLLDGEDFLEHVRQHLYGYASDGAEVMKSLGIVIECILQT